MIRETEMTSSTCGVVEFSLKSITGTEVKGKYDNDIASIEFGARIISTANKTGNIKNMVIIPVNCCASWSPFTIDPNPMKIEE